MGSLNKDVWNCYQILDLSKEALAIGICGVHLVRIFMPISELNEKKILFRWICAQNHHISQNRQNAWCCRNNKTAPLRLVFGKNMVTCRGLKYLRATKDCRYNKIIKKFCFFFQWSMHKKGQSLNKIITFYIPNTFHLNVLKYLSLVFTFSKKKL